MAAVRAIAALRAGTWQVQALPDAYGPGVAVDQSV
jgi:hypothetical protein